MKKHITYYWKQAYNRFIYCTNSTFFVFHSYFSGNKYSG